MIQEFDNYSEFARHMEEQYPRMFSGPYGGFDVGPGWWPIIQHLCQDIQRHIDYTNERRKVLLESNPFDVQIPDVVEQVFVEQIKEKFGGLRFYYLGGDAKIEGMVRMAESWASTVCEQCGHPGKIRTDGWMKTLCDQHEAERQARTVQR